MKKFLNYILVAGVAVLGFAGTVYAGEGDAADTPATQAETADAILINGAKVEFAEVVKKYEKGITVNVLNNKSADMVNKAITDTIATNKLTGKFAVKATAPVAANATTVTIGLYATDDKGKIADDATAIETSAAIDIKYYDGFSSDDMTKINKNVTKLKTDLNDTYELTDLALVKYLVDTKADDRYQNALSSLATFKANASSVSGYTVELNKGNRGTGASANEVTYTAYIKYNNVYVDEATVTLTIKEELLVPIGTTTENVAEVLQARINSIDTVSSSKVTIDATTGKATIVANNEAVLGTYTVTPSKDAGNYNAATSTASTIASNSTEVTATADKAVTAGTKLVVTKIEDATELAKAVAKDVKDIVAYDIKLVDSADKEVKFDGVKYTVTVTIPENLKGKDLAAYTIVDGKLEEHKITVDGDKGTFTTTHFSEWIITEVVKVGEDGKVLPNTLDNAASFAFVGVIGLVGMAASALFLNKRN